jgi:membrane-bound serine protease (ClpP class)
MRVSTGPGARSGGGGLGRRLVRFVLAGVVAATGLAGALVAHDGPAAAQVSAQGEGTGGPEVVLVDLDHQIDNVTARFLARALDEAADDGAELVVVQLDTPGGLVDAMRDMVRDILAAPVPVVVYVAPSGARAASAGTFVTAAGGVAAMAPVTNIGAASVVGGGGEDLPDTLERKATQDAAALLRSIAEQRGRNAEALEAAVFEATAYSAAEAVELGVVDLIAADLDDLLAQLDGRTIATAAGPRTVDTTGATVRRIDLNVFERVLEVISNPTISFLLISIGGLLLIVEIFNFGTVVPGVLGVAMLVLGFAGVGQLPFSWAGVALILAALGLFVAEAHAPGFGFFGIAGMVALVLGGVFLVGFFGSPVLPGTPSRSVNRWVIGVVAGVLGVAVTALAWQLRRSATMPGYVSPLSGAGLRGQVARVTRRLDPEGEVHVGGEFWEARLVDGGAAEVDSRVRVRGLDGRVLEVETVEAPDHESGRDAGETSPGPPPRAR